MGWPPKGGPVRREPEVRILILNQCFYPDLAATAQYAADFAEFLAGTGHEVTVLTSRNGYGDRRVRYPARQLWQGVQILRLAAPEWGKSSAAARIATAAGFWIAAAKRLLKLGTFDLTISLTSPPLIGALAALYKRMTGGRLVQWIMDLNPDEAIAAGWLDPQGCLAQILERLLRFALAEADAIIALDPAMRERILLRVDSPSNVHTIPLWARQHILRASTSQREAFRTRHGFADRFVVMYAGNHSPCHPLKTLLEAARLLQYDSRLLFCFAGGGRSYASVREYCSTHGLANVAFIPYQPTDQLGAMLSAADLQVVVLGDRFQGIVHPSKTYNILAVGVPLLYIGPSGPYLDTFASDADTERWLWHARHGEVQYLATLLHQARTSSFRGLPTQQAVADRFTPSKQLPRLAAAMDIPLAPTSLPEPANQELATCLPCSAHSPA